MTDEPPDWAEVNLRQAKIIIMQAIIDAEKRGERRGWERAVNEAASRMHGENGKLFKEHMPFPEDKQT